jgi:hypothetical protein
MSSPWSTPAIAARGTPGVLLAPVVFGSPPDWQPIEALPIVAQLIADGLDSAAEHRATLGEAGRFPG